MIQVELANSLFGSEDVLNPVVNYEAPFNPLPPSSDPFDLTSNQVPNKGEAQFVSPEIPFSIQDILEALDEVNQYPPSDGGYERPYSPSPPLSYPPATHPPVPVIIHENLPQPPIHPEIIHENCVFILPCSTGFDFAISSTSSWRSHCLRSNQKHK